MVSTPTERRLISQAYVKLDGTDLPRPMMDDLLRIRVDGSVHLPDMAVLEFDNPDMKWSEQDSVEIGQEIKIYFGDADLKSDEPMFAGEVTALELDVGMAGNVVLRIRGYDRAHRLHRGRMTRVFLNVTDADIATQIAGELGLQTDIEPTPGVQEYVLQYNQTNWEFLQQRAARHGFELQVADRKLVFKPPPSTPREPIDLVWNQELLSFRASMATGDQVNAVEVRGWDPVNKKEIVGNASRPGGLPQVGESRTGGEVSQSAFQREAKMLVARHPVYDQEQAQRLAQHVLDELAGNFITAQGVAMGDPKLQLGSEVNLKSVGKQFTGRYVVTQVSHRYEPEGYMIEFEVTGRRSTDLVSLISPPPAAETQVMTGVVTSTRDPRDMGRVKVKLPWLGDSIETNWCRVVVPGGGVDRGLQFLPEVDDEVLLIGSSMDNLYVLGGLWSIADLPPRKNSQAAPSGDVNQRVIRSRTGHEIVIDDGPDATGILISDSGGNKLQVKTGDNSIAIEAGGDIKIKAGGSIELDAGVDFKVHAKVNIDEEANFNATLKGNGQAVLEGTGSVSVQSNGQASLRAPSVGLG